MGKKENKKIAMERISILFNKAETFALDGNIKKANRYVELARKIGMRYNVSIPSKYRQRVCKNCYSYLLPGETCKIRIRDGLIISRCLNCGNFNRFGYNISKKGGRKR